MRSAHRILAVASLSFGAAVRAGGLDGLDDAVMIAAAKTLGCHEILAEDLNDGQTYCGMVAVNPFKETAG